ncbi:MAG: DUF2461 domain-containing protein [Dysgonomonas sp.]
MLKKDTFTFLETLQQNNSREWFTENKAWYERARTDFEGLVSEVIRNLAIFEPEIGHLNPKKCIFRIYRDTRFSTDKTPYKTNFGAVFQSNFREKGSGYYLHLSPGECFLSCGFYMLQSEQLKKIRKGIYDDFEMFQEILNEKQFKKEIGDLYRDDDMLQRVPNGFDKNHPAAEYMKLKHFYVMRSVTEEQILSEDLASYAARIYKIMKPLSEFLDDLVTE